MKLITLLKQWGVKCPNKAEQSNEPWGGIEDSIAEEFTDGFNACHDQWANIEVTDRGHRLCLLMKSEIGRQVHSALSYREQERFRKIIDDAYIYALNSIKES